MATTLQLLAQLKKEYLAKTGKKAIIRSSKGVVTFPLFEAWCSSHDECLGEDEARLSSLLVSVSNLYLTHRDDVFPIIDGLLPNITCPKDRVSWFHGYLTGVADIPPEEIVISFEQDDDDGDLDEPE